jgi:hypothetical protein
MGPGGSCRGFNADDCSIQRRKIHVMRSRLVEPPITFAALAAISSRWVKAAKNGVFAHAYDCGGLDLLIEASVGLETIDLYITVTRADFYKQNLPLGGW